MRNRWLTRSKTDGSSRDRLIAYAMRDAPKTPEFDEISSRIAPSTGTYSAASVPKYGTFAASTATAEPAFSGLPRNWKNVCA